MFIKNTSGFTLIELLFGVTLSAILMTGIVVFVSSSLGSNIATKQTLEEGNKNDEFKQHLTESLGNIGENGIYKTGSSFGEYSTGIFLSTTGPNLPITFLGLKTETGFCDSYSGTASETGTVNKLILRQFILPQIQNTATGYTLSLTGNSIFSGTTRIIGTGYPGDTLSDSGIDTELSSPSALISSGTYLYIADTMNDRVLSYNVTSSGITQLIGAENGLSKPTSLYLSGNTLLIASSGNGKIFSLQDGEGDGVIFSNNFKVSRNFQANMLQFTFSGISSITLPNNDGNFFFSGITGAINGIVNTGSNLQYTFSGGAKTFSSGNAYGITINNISPTPINLGNNTVQIDFFDSGVLQYSETFHHTTKGHGSLENITGNVLKTLSGGITYPHNITGPNTWNEMIDGNTIFSNNPPGEEIVSYLPIQDFTYQVIGEVLTLRYNEYKQYDCILGKHKTEEKIIKILLR